MQMRNSNCKNRLGPGVGGKIAKDGERERRKKAAEGENKEKETTLLCECAIYVRYIFTTGPRNLFVIFYFIRRDVL